MTKPVLELLKDSWVGGGRAPKAVESRHARYMRSLEGTLLDPTVKGCGAPLLQNSRFFYL